MLRKVDQVLTLMFCFVGSVDEYMVLLCTGHVAVTCISTTSVTCS